jgi:hypothetical protein
MNPLQPNKALFEQDPFGYSTSAPLRWAIAQNLAGLPIDPNNPPANQDLKSPVLWLSQAHAMAQAGISVIRSEPDLTQMPNIIHGICDSQYRAVGLMLVGYSLEICLKAMLIIRNGIEAYTKNEKAYKHHKLEELSNFIPNLSEKEKAILRLLTYFVYWAGRYPDPGSSRQEETGAIFKMSEQYKISAKDLFGLAGRVMQHAKEVIG